MKIEISGLKQNQIDYNNFLRSNKNLSFNKSMKEFRKFWYELFYFQNFYKLERLN